VKTAGTCCDLLLRLRMVAVCNTSSMTDVVF